MFYSGGDVPVEKRGRGGGCRRGIRVSLAKMPATRSKASGALETGEGEQVPPPRRPHPPWRYAPRSSARGDPGEEPDTASHQLHPGHGCSPDIATYGPRPRGGGGGGAPKARAGWGGRQKCMGILAAGAGGVGGAGKSAWVSLPQAWAGRGSPEKCMGIPLQRCGRGGGCRQRCMGSLLAKARAGWGVPAESVWVSPTEGAGGAGAAGRSAWVAAGGGAGKGCWREVR